MNYPYYIVQWSEGRLRCPPHQRMISAVKRMYETGRIGGKKLVERQTQSPTEAKNLWAQDRMNRRVYVVKARNRHRELVRRPWELKETS